MLYNFIFFKTFLFVKEFIRPKLKDYAGPAFFLISFIELLNVFVVLSIFNLSGKLGLLILFLLLMVNYNRFIKNDKWMKIVANENLKNLNAGRIRHLSSALILLYAIGSFVLFLVKFISK